MANTDSSGQVDGLRLPAGVQVRRFAGPEALAAALAEAIAQALRAAIAARGAARLVVSGGRSPIALFHALSAQELAWSQVLVGLADERWVAETDAHSNAGLVSEHLLRGPAAQARLLGLYQPADSLEQAALLADRVLGELHPPLDVLVLGMGDDGHTASLFPGSPRLAEALRDDCPRRCLPMQAPSAPEQRLSLTLPVLASASTCFLAIQGASKHATLARALAGDDALVMPIRALLHPPLQIYSCP